MLVALSEKGRAFDREHLNLITENDRCAMQGFTPAEEAQLTALLQSCGFTDVHVYGNSRMESPRDKEQRWHFTARRPEEE